MTRHATPRVSIGMPVYNGENYLEQALRALLAQTFPDFEVVISDNASTDRTARICRDYMASDYRIRYVRQPRNIGVAGNFNAVFHHATGEYFQWAAHDDLLEPACLEGTVEALDSDPSAVLSYARTASIDDRNQRLKSWAPRPALGSPAPHWRFREILIRMEPFAIFGLIRSHVLRRTTLYGRFWGADFVLLAELSLAGRFVEVPEELFLLRHHEGRSTFVYDWRTPERTTALFDPGRTTPFRAPNWMLMRAYLRALRRAPLGPAEKLRCYREYLHDLATRDRLAELTRDVGMMVPGMPVIGSLAARLRRYLVLRSWSRRVRRAMDDLRGVVPPGESLVLIDQASFPPQACAGWRVLPFLERQGQYWGCPADDSTAIAELERLRTTGARFLVIAWPGFWWLQHYDEWNRYLRLSFRCLLANDRVVVFDLGTT